MFEIVAEVPSNDSRLFVVFNGALTAGKRSDFSIAIACLFYSGTIFITNIFRRKLEYNQLKIEFVDRIRSVNRYDSRTRFMQNRRLVDNRSFPILK